MLYLTAVSPAVNTSHAVATLLQKAPANALYVLFYTQLQWKIVMQVHK